MANMHRKQPRPLKVLHTEPTPALISIVGCSGSGKTTFMEKLIPEFRRLGLRVGTVKHDVHGFEMDKPGKDSWRHKKAGASTTIISSKNRIGMVMDMDRDREPEELLKYFSGLDIVLTEGYKRGARAKIEVFRSAVGDGPLCVGDPHLLALVSDADVDVQVPVFSPGDPKGVAAFIVDRFDLSVSKRSGHRKSAQ